MTSALIIFVRNPLPGKVKTRIGKEKGDEYALAVYTRLLQHTCTITCNLPFDIFVFYADYVNDNDLWNGPPFYKLLQKGTDLGERMCNAFSFVFDRGYRQVAIIGSDCLELTPELLLQAFTQLNTNDVVLGPSEDGGYYLLGMNKPQPELFINKNWSTDTVADDTIANVQAMQLSLFSLPQLSDVDTAADCLKYAEFNGL